jgi:uncharacterized protein with FMN-binding domain
VNGFVIPVRASVAVVATAISLVLLLSFKTPDTTRPRNPLAAISSPAPDASPTPSDSGSGAPVAVAPSPTPPPAGPSYKDGQYTGRDYQTEYGDNQVKVVITNGRIVDVQPLQLPFDRQRSAYISQVAGPMLRTEALKAQSAQIDIVSGATFTSDAYAQSLQSALDQARA